jgi:uncharacterized membrane protein
MVSEESRRRTIDHEIRVWGYILKKFFIGIVLIICGILLLITTNHKSVSEVEEYVVTAYIFLFSGILYIVYKAFKKG